MGATLRKDYVGNIATGVLTLNSPKIAVKATGTITLATAVAGDTVTVNGLLYTAVAGTKDNNTEFSIDVSNTAAATDLKNSITADTRVSGTGMDVIATSSGAIVTVQAKDFGVTGNEIPLASSSQVKLAVSGATLQNGSDADIVYVNGLSYTPVAGAKADDTEYSVDTSSTAAATDLADSIDDDVRVGNQNVLITGTSSANKIVIVATGEDAHRVLVVGSNNIVSGGSTLNLNSMDSNVPLNNQTLKRINFLNTPFSVEATGADKIPNRIKVVDSTATFNTITVRTRVLWGNRDGYISAITPSTSLVFTWIDKKNNKVNTTKTMAQVIASGSMVILNETI